MKKILFVLCFVLGCVQQSIPASREQSLPVPAAPIPEFPDGSVVLLKNVSWAIQWYTKSNLHHAAIIFNIDGKPWVYEATLPSVRKMPLDDYYLAFRHLNPYANEKKTRCVRMKILKPKMLYTPEEVALMFEFAESHLGEKYRLFGYFDEEDQEGTHCSQFVTNVLLQSGRYYLDNFDVGTPRKVSPKRLFDAIENDYESGLWIKPKDL